MTFTIGLRTSVLARIVATAMGVAFAEGVQAQSLVAIDADAGTNSRGALFRVDTASGNRTLVSDFGDAGQGPLGLAPWAVAFAPAGLVVADQRAGTLCTPISGCGALFFVDPVTGARRLLSDFGDPAQGPTGFRLYGIAVEANGDLLIIDQDAGGSGRGLLFRVSPSDGTRTIVSNFADPNQGPTGGEPSSVAVEASGAVLVSDANTNSFPSGAVFRINPQTGQRTIVSDFTDAAQGPIGGLPIDVEPGFGGVLWVLDQVSALGPGAGQLFQVNASTGARSIVSNFTTTAQGPLGFNLNDVKVNAGGFLLVMDFDAGTNSRGALFFVDPVTGSRSYLSDFGDAAQGALGVEPSGFALEPPPPPDTNTLTIVNQGTGNGLVVSDVPGIDCGGDCSEAYAVTQSVVLSAFVDGNSKFDGWTGDPDCADGIVQMDIDHVCIATFKKKGGKIIVAPDLYADAEGPVVVQLSPDLSDPGPYRVYVGVGNRGLQAAGPSIARLYLSIDHKVSADDLLVAETVTPALPAGPSGQTVRLAERVLKELRGRFYMIVVLDATGVVGESDETNNISVNRYEFPCQPGLSFASSRCTPR